MSRRLDRICFVGSPNPRARIALAEMEERYGSALPSEADVIVALGGDGLMLRTAHQFMHAPIPIYGMHCGSVGFLMNEYSVDDLEARLQAAQRTDVRPLMMTAYDQKGDVHRARAINEVSLLRQSYQAAKLRIYIDGRKRLDELICDGLLVATPAGSTAYNLSAYGPILPIDAPLLALTPISPFRPRRWRGALLPNQAKLSIEVLSPADRPVSVAADHHEHRDLVRVEVAQDPDITIPMLFDPGHNLDERILREQFFY